MPVGNVLGETNGSSFFDKIGPGGEYFKYSRIAVISLGVLSLGILTVLFFPQIKNLFVKPPAPQQLGVKCEPAPPLPKGFQSWEFSHGDEVKGPKIQTATIDTLTPPMGAAQTLTLTIKSDSPVKKAIATLFTDSTSQSYPLELNKGTDTNGTWVGTWQTNDSYECVYHISFVLENESNSWTGALTFR
jgi:hypothetical protein